MKWYEKSANGGNADAQNIVGNMYSDKDLGILDLKKAFNYYKKAAEQDHIYGMFNLGLCYAEGNGCPKDMRKALNWIEKAANEACPEAQQWVSNYNQSLQEQEKLKGKKTTSPKESQPKEKTKAIEKTEDVIIENVCFSTDGRKTLFLEYECQYNCDYKEDGIVLFAINIDGKKMVWNGAANGFGNQLAKNRESFKEQYKDFELNLKTNATNTIKISIEARKNDSSWDGSQNLDTLPLIASYKAKVKLYYEWHMFGKNVLEVRK